MKITDANGVKGFLIWTGETYMFRVYDGLDNFTDYDIRHHDLEVRIIDDTARLYENGYGTPYVDYSERILGLRENDKA